MQRKKDDGRADKKSNNGRSTSRGRRGIAIATLMVALVCMAYGGSMRDNPMSNDKTPV
ncbi:hypothetical protein [Streptomyces kanamyceticus]|uniref:hypothetical protein n=1 Tax=Streptomyces kanamyceticus TaxID=1967 RepID=UPI000A760A55|nr:hypothetical protein [Streptomyces kanamyceticus]